MKLESMLVIDPSALSILVYLLSILRSLSSKVLCCELVIDGATGGMVESSIVVFCCVAVRETSIGIGMEGVTEVESGIDNCCSIAVKRAS